MNILFTFQIIGACTLDSKIKFEQEIRKKKKIQYMIAVLWVGLLNKKAHLTDSERDLCKKVTSNLKYHNLVSKANSILDLLTRGFVSRDKNTW